MVLVADSLIGEQRVDAYKYYAYPAVFADIANHGNFSEFFKIFHRLQMVNPYTFSYAFKYNTFRTVLMDVHFNHFSSNDLVHKGFR